MELDPEVEKGLLCDLIARLVIAISIVIFLFACGYRFYLEVKPFADAGLAFIFGSAPLSFKKSL